MKSSRPYIVRALYEWILDNECTPYVLVDAEREQVQVPTQYVKNGQIVLNVSPQAVMNLSLDNDIMTFNGRFGGVAMDISVPMNAVLGIYARENGQGMLFDPDEPPPIAPGPQRSEVHKQAAEKNKGQGKNSRPSLKVVK